MTYFSTTQKLDMIKVICESFNEFENDCSKIEQIKEILYINQNIDKRETEKASK